MKQTTLIAVLLLFTSKWVFAVEQIAVFPTKPYDQSTIYLNLALLWAGILGLIAILLLKLKEIERVQKLDGSQDKDVVHFLD